MLSPLVKVSISVSESVPMVEPSSTVNEPAATAPSTATEAPCRAPEPETVLVDTTEPPVTDPSEARSSSKVVEPLRVAAPN